ncbi:OLC1v1019697C4 [Oldenlandia corymbosa var. corymbosa]|uniref:OLC1v1019697C4 n=1 Tax=Oldenlandia corymbosa var. corymbosa TaxID=529605 RepID=A0AAV1EEL9_OLDCO|nr:OLC1v1019697C4 [Oldenlandia corymbosa var. corymbosa]
MTNDFSSLHKLFKPRAAQSICIKPYSWNMLPKTGKKKRKKKMAFQLICKSKVGRCRNSFLVCFLLTWLSSVAIAKKYEPTNIGAIIDVDSRIGKEQQIALKIAVQGFNDLPSNDQRLVLHFKNNSDNPMQAVSAAEQLIRENQVKVIIGLKTWEQSVMVADVGKGDEVPVLSLASSSNRPLFMQQRWPFLMPMVPNISDQITCISEVIGSYNWRKVVAIYEDNTYAGDSELIAVLSRALQQVDAEIESHLVLPPLSSVPDPEGMIRDEVANLIRSQSRVFVVLRSSLSLASYLFKEAKKIGLMCRDSVWIISNSLSDLLDSVEPSSISYMQGAIGIKNFYSENTAPFQRFKYEFKRNFRAEYPDEHNSEPGIHALRAYDAITAVSKAVMESLNEDNKNHSTSLLRMVQSSNFTGLSGDVRFQGNAISGESVFSIVNVVGKSYKELGFWSPSFSFTNSSLGQSGKANISAVSRVRSMQDLTSLVNWPGELNRIPKGWAMPTDVAPMKIGIPGRTTFDKFVKVDWADWTNNRKEPTGFCIDVFQEALKIVEEEYTLFYEFVPYNGSYDELVDCVYNKTFGAAVGDITILENRSKYVDFTHPFAESGLSMMVKVEQEDHRAWMFMKPFTFNMWVATFSIMFYTMFVVWFMEHQTNPEFRGPWKDQLGTAMWFTFSTLFFAHS